ncbi:MAG: LemA family protein [Dehalococcoidales bacterium]|jgi:LemA protein|nr:LemA family protein [Dehalococcoidales bacterium]MDD5498183.1 LemA family protein [Dehalococcoidales bacterium]MDX9802935.1 LemA family protein [Dehalococcoidales bacterium]
MIGVWIALGVIVVLILAIVALYNGLVRLRNEVKNAWAQIDVQLKRRYDLIPNLVETVKGYAKHERETFEAVTNARTIAQKMSDAGAQARSKAEGELSSALMRLLAVAEAYPDLKANQNFLALQEELTSTENKISFARQFYNDAVLRYNNQTQMFPSSIIAGMFGFQGSEFFEVTESVQREAPKVSFS